MSLRVWLPLNGNLDNQGLDQVTVTNNGATIDNNGKIGKCYSFGTGNSYIVIDSTPLKTFTEFSFACWVKIISWNTNYSTIFAAKNSTSTSWNNLIFSLLRSGSNSILCFNISNGTSYTATNCYTGILSTNTWYHIVCTYEEGKIKLYQDGNIVNTYNTTVIPNFDSIANLWIGKSNENTYQSNNLLNDVRIYDHCLSPLEVKQISQGLILHYPLNRNGWGNENILINTHFDSQTTKTSGWDTTKNGTQMASYWGGFNGGVSNASTVYHAHLKQINNEWVYEYIRTADEDWLGISQRGLQLKLIAGKTYTFSWEEYRVEGNNYPTGGLYYFKTEATSANFHLGQFGGSNGNVLGKWRKFSYTFIAPTDGDYSKNMSWYIYGQFGGNGKMYIRHPKLEEGSMATPWCPNSSDTLATTMGLNDNVEYDTSGYGNNGTKINTLTYSSDTPKYNVSTHFGATNQKIHIDNLTTTGFSNSYSFAWWGKRTSNIPMFWGFNNGVRLNGMYLGTLWNTGDSSSNPIYQPNTTTTTIIAPSVNTWHHYVMTGDGAVCKLYLDGELYGQAKTYKSITGTSIFINGWNNDTSYSHDNMDMSDFRIYATALSADDIKSLYNNSAYIDNQGNIYGAVYEEA